MLDLCSESQRNQSFMQDSVVSKAGALELERQGLHSESNIFQPYDSGELFHISEPGFLICKVKVITFASQGCCQA